MSSNIEFKNITNGPISERKEPTTPINKSPSKFRFSPSNKASPAPKPHRIDHLAPQILKQSGKQFFERDLPRKAKHTVVYTSPNKGDVLTRPDVAEYVSKAGKHIETKNEIPPPFQASPNTKIVVKARKRIEVHNLKNHRVREYAAHSTRNNQAPQDILYPTKGDGVETFGPDEALSFQDLREITDEYRTAAKIDKKLTPQRFFKQQVEQRKSLKTATQSPQSSHADREAFRKSLKEATSAFQDLHDLS